MFVVGVAVSVSAVPPWELETPVFVSCPDYDFGRISHCTDVVTFDFRAVIPNQPGARGRIRYILVSGPGEIDEKSGRWTWYPTEDDLMTYYDVEVAASIHNTDIVSAPEDNCRFPVSYRDTPAKAVPLFPLLGSGRVPIVRIAAPSDTLLPYSLVEPDPCDSASLTVSDIQPEPVGRIVIVDESVLHVQLAPEDQGQKFVVGMEIHSGLTSSSSHLVIETRDSVTLQFTDCPSGDTLRVSPGERFIYRLMASDIDFPESWEGILYYMVSPADRRHGSVSTSSGTYYFRPRPEQLGEVFEVVVTAEYADTRISDDQNCRFWVAVVPNEPPQFTDTPCGDTLRATAGVMLEVPTNVIDPDSSLNYGWVHLFIAGVTPQPGGALDTIWMRTPDSSALGLRFHPADAGHLFAVTLGATDTYDTTYCEFFVDVAAPPDQELAVAIERTEETLMGEPESIDITVTDNTFDLMGYDLVVNYPTNALTLQNVSPGLFHDQCDWEYFTYRYGPFAECHPNCPSGLLRIVALAETNNGDVHPTCFNAETPFTLATIDFLVSTDRTLDCTWQPIRFMWLDCGDNMFARGEWGGDNLLSARRVFDWVDDSLIEITDHDTDFPTYYGQPHECLTIDPGAPYMVADFYHGGVQIEFADSIDDSHCTRGDINLNRIPHEIADAVMYSNLLVHMPIPINDSACLARTSDVNADDTPWSVEDFVYLVRIITGDALPYPHPAPPGPEVYFNLVEITGPETRITVDTPEPLGAVLMTFEDSIDVVSHPGAREAIWHYSPDENATRVLLYDFDSGSIGEGELMTLRNAGFPVSVEAATYDGLPVREYFSPQLDVPDGATLPADFALHQNHPNPFNIETVISFDLPSAEAVSVEIFNVAGRKVYSLRGHYAAGRHDLLWDGTDNSGNVVASGVYYYRIAAGNHVASRKMVLLK
jgi:hypothetical protein